MKFSASEMFCLVRYLGVMIGDLVPRDEKSWKLYIYLRKIIDILVSPRIDSEFIRKLKVYVQNLNQLYVENFGNLKPKFHFLTHYASVLEYFGPCVHFQGMRYESRNKEIKANFEATSSKKNPLITIAFKQILKLCKIVDSLRFENKIKFNSEDKSDANNKYYKSVTVNGNIYKVGSFVIVNLEKD